MTEYQRLLREHGEMVETLTHAQAKCSELLEEARAARRDDYSEDFSYLLAFTWPLSLPAVGAHIEDLERDLDCERTP
jgi:hypothetical protein